MTKRHYFQSLVIFFAAGYFVKTVLDIHWFETFLLLLLMIVCVLHTMDVRDDISSKLLAKKIIKENGNGSNGGST